MINRIRKRLANSLAHDRLIKTLSAEAEPGFVYLIQCHNFTKIGITQNVQNRLTTLSTACPYPLTLLRSVHCGNAPKLESALHELFDQFHTQGEWFSIPKDILDCVLSMNDDCFRDLPNFKRSEMLLSLK